MTNRMNVRDIQLANEYQFNKKHIDGYIQREIQDNPGMTSKIHHGIQLLEDWVVQDYFPSKNRRLAQLAELNLEKVVLDLFVLVAYCQKPELFTSVTAQGAGKLQFSEKEDGIRTVGEILAILCETDAFDITKDAPQSSLMIQSRIPLSRELIQFVRQSAYLPPMVCPPKELTKNFQSAYLTHTDSVILGKSNHHEGDVCLDVLNTQNQVPLRINTEFLCRVEEQPTFEIDTVEKQRNWNAFKLQSYQFYLRMAQQNDGVVYLTNKYDKRGRMYAQGYHVSTQATAFKKAMLDFANAEITEGVPT